MSLRKQLSDLLIELLPASPKDAIKGTELIRLIRLRLQGKYSDASLRYHFSIMSCDPSSPIAKVEKGQGYYRRSAHLPALSGAHELVSLTQGRLDELQDQDEIDHVLLRVRKFHAVVQKYAESRELFTFRFHESLAQEAQYGNLWKFPEMVWINWERGEYLDEGLELDPRHLRLKNQLALPPYHLDSVRLRLSARHESIREDLFQCMSASLWAQGGELIYAESLEDEYLGEQIRLLAEVSGVGVTTFGLTLDELGDLPHPEQILNAQPRETEALLERLDIERLATAKTRSHCRWDVLQDLWNDYDEIKKLFDWIDESISEGFVKPYQHSEEAPASEELAEAEEEA
ncbi:MAG: hypothetical protein ACQKBY_04765 [Verrucomicrobiales bacterium]